MMEKWNYFVSFAHTTGFGYRTVDMPRKIEQPSHIVELEKLVMELAGFDLAIINFILLNGPSNRG
jgi:hypothetical protein